MPQTKERRKHYKNICFEVRWDQYKAFTDKAKENKETKSDLLRKFVDEYVKS